MPESVWMPLGIISGP